MRIHNKTIFISKKGIIIKASTDSQLITTIKISTKITTIVIKN